MLSLSVGLNNKHQVLAFCIYSTELGTQGRISKFIKNERKGGGEKKRERKEEKKRKLS